MRPSATRSSPRATGTRSRCSSSRERGAPRSSPAASGCRRVISLPARIEDGFSRRLRQLPPDTQLLVLAAAAEPLGDPVLLHSAAESLEIDMAAVDPAVDAGLLTVGRRVEFSHPLVRSSAYRSAATQDRHRVHRALAEATDPDHDPDRRAWHRARATSGPDEEVAAELERSAGTRTGSGWGCGRGGVPAASDGTDRRPDSSLGAGCRCGGSELPGGRVRGGAQARDNRRSRADRRVPACPSEPPARRRRARTRVRR